jgi:hypothetical protein
MRLGALILIALAGCKQTVPTSAAGRANFELDCESSDTATAAELFCVRTDTRNGAVLRVNYTALPTSNGPTAVEKSAAAGRYTTECDATSTDTRSDFYCIRLDTETGDMLLVNLTKIDQLPAKPAPQAPPK